MSRAVLFDADGVLTLPEDFFSRAYATKHGLDLSPIDTFFKGPFQDTTIGDADLKELLVAHKDIWQHDSVDALLDEWFAFEDVRNESLLKLVATLRERGTSCYVATNQEKYRGNYMREVMFKNQFDGFYISNEMHRMKPHADYFEYVLKHLQAKYPDMTPADVWFFDDSQPNIDAARALGIEAHFYTDVTQVEQLLKQNNGNS